MNSLTLNPLLSQLKPSATLAINQRVHHLRQQGNTVYHWGFGQSPFPVPALIADALKAHAGEKAYLPGLGLPELREAVAEYYQHEFDYKVEAEQVVIGPGSKELIYNLMYLIPGELLMPAPSWVSYAPQATLLNKPYRYIQTRADNNYCLSADELEQALKASTTPGTPMLILNSPNNPTGVMYNQENLEQLADVCRRYGVLVISDEIYAKVNFNQQFHASMAYCYPEGTFITAGLSKLFAAGGYRLGVGIMPEAFRAQLSRPWSTLISETFSCVSSPVQYAAVAAYAQFDQLRDELADMVAIQRIASETIYQCFVDNDIACPAPQGAFYLMPDFNHQREALQAQGVTNSIELADWLLEKAHIATLPGCEFGLPKEQLCLRVASVDFDGGEALAQYSADRSIDASTFAQQALPSIVKACQQLQTTLQSLNATVSA